MLNAVGTTENVNNKPFGTFSNNDANTHYWLNSDEGDQVTLKTQNKKRKRAKAIKTIGFTAAGTIIATTGALLFLLKGGPKGLNKFIQRLQVYYFNKLQQSKLKGEEISNRANFIFSKLNSLAGKIEAGNNFTTMKDYAFKRIMYVLGTPARKIHNGITKLFERLGRNTVVRSYSSTAVRFFKTKCLNDHFIEKLLQSNDLDKEIIINGVKRTKKEWIEILRTTTEHVESTYTTHFKPSRQEDRYKQMHQFTQELEDEFKKKGDLWFLSKDIFKAFIAEQKMLKNKMHLQIPLKTVRRQISYTPADLFEEANASIMRMSSLLGFKDKEALTALNTLRTDLKNIKLKDGKLPTEKILEDIDKFVAIFEKTANPKDKSKIYALRDILKIKASVTEFKQGNVEEILAIYKGLLPESQYKQIEKSYQKALTSFDKSLGLETEEFVNKLRDLSMGSAPTDILTILTGVGTLGYYLTKADNSQERLGITLKYGIPALTLIGTCLYGNARLFAGTKSLAFGLATSWIFNRIGSAANDILQKHFEKKNNLKIQESINLKQA